MCTHSDGGRGEAPMRPPPGDDSGRRARLAQAGVPTDLADGEICGSEFDLWEVAVLRAAWESTLSDEDLYPLLVQYWTGQRPTANWPPDAPALARRCATRLAIRSPCGFDTSMHAPTREALDAARDAIIDDLHLTPSGLLRAAAVHWPQLKGLEMPIDVERTLLAFARHALLEPVAGACALIWCTLDASSSSATPDEPIERGHWPTAHGFDEDHMVATELARLGQPEQRVPYDGDEAEALLASGRAAAMQLQNGRLLAAASIVRTSGWPGDDSLVAAIARDAVHLASEHADDVNPDSDNDALLSEIQQHLLPPPDDLIMWARDIGFATLLDPSGGARTGDEMLKAAADWLTWGLVHDAVEVVVAMRRDAKPGS
jgi:hypothetical protein